GIIIAEEEEADGRKVNYRLTEKGIDLAPVLLELLIWGARYEETGAPCARIAEMAKNREAVLAEVRRRWREWDPTPLIPKLSVRGAGHHLAGMASTLSPSAIDRGPFSPHKNLRSTEKRLTAATRGGQSECSKNV
ncbi:MAG: winged helix-turn-helix transcriptional regulator, partial [Terriglobia bacterium]